MQRKNQARHSEVAKLLSMGGCVFVKDTLAFRATPFASFEAQHP
ncbi:hypothetical protein [Variovorax sp. OK202]|nr:hypothetical protein [Variovorax sp. OK202]